MDTTLKGVLESLKQSNSAAGTPKEEEKPKEYQGVKMEMEECRLLFCLIFIYKSYLQIDQIDL